MNRQRTIVAAPIRSAADAWQIVTTLLTDTLARSASIPTGSVTQELDALCGLGPALIAGGHLESKGMVLVDVNLHLTITVLTADAAFDVDENLNPVPGGTSATTDWMLYLPNAGPLNASIATAVKKSAHLSADPPPTSPSSAKERDHSARSLIDPALLRRMEIK